MSRVTLDRIDQKLTDLKELLTKHMVDYGDHVKSDRDDFDKVYEKINSLRRWQAWVVGVGTTIITVTTVYLAWVR